MSDNATPIEQAGEALVDKAEADEEALGTVSDEGWDSAHDQSLLQSHVVAGVTERIEGPPAIIARAVFASIDREALAAFLDSPTHAPMSTHDTREGACTECPGPVHQLPPAEMADAIIAWLTAKTGEEQS